MAKEKISFPPRLYFIKDTEQIIGRSRQTLRRWWIKNYFPKPILLNKRLAWEVSVIEQWISENLTHGNDSY